jgi:hypothetical protein
VVENQKGGRKGANNSRINDIGSWGIREKGNTQEVDP